MSNQMFWTPHTWASVLRMCPILWVPWMQRQPGLQPERAGFLSLLLDLPKSLQSPALWTADSLYLLFWTHSEGRKVGGMVLKSP